MLFRSGTVPSKYYNGTFAVISVFETASNTYGFTYRMPGNPTAPADLSNSDFIPNYQTRWQAFRFCVENNVFEVYQTDANSYGSPLGMSTYGYPADVDSSDVVLPAPFIFPQIVIRDNVFRHRNDQVVGGDNSSAVVVTSVQGGIIQANTIGFLGSEQVKYHVGKNVRTLGNQSASGKIFHPFEWNDTSNKYEVRDDLETFIEDVTLLAL